MNIASKPRIWNPDSSPPFRSELSNPSKPLGQGVVVNVLIDGDLKEAVEVSRRPVRSLPAGPGYLLPLTKHLVALYTFTSFVLHK